MATLSIDNDQPTVEFTWRERPFTLRRRVDIPLAAARESRSQQRPFAATCSRLLVAVRRNTTALHITTEPGFDGLFDEILVSASETAVAAALTRRV